MFKELFAILFSESHFVRLAGTSLEDARVNQKQFRSDLKEAAVGVFCAFLCGLAVGAVSGHLSTRWSWSVGKSIAVVGVLLTSWPTWFILANPNPSWKSRLDERLRPFCFKVLFFPGVVLLVAAGMA